MRSDIRWLGFWDDFPWIVAGLIVWLLVTFVSLAFVLTGPDMPKWLQVVIVVLAQLLFGAFVYWRTRRARLRRAAKLKDVAQQAGMTFTALPRDDNSMPPRDLPFMAKRHGRPRNLLVGEHSGVNVSLFDLAAGISKSVREQTIAYFPQPLPGLGNFPDDWLDLGKSAAHTALATEFSGLSIEARRGLLIVYRWHHLVRPESYPEFLALAQQIHEKLARLAQAEDGAG